MKKTDVTVQDLLYALLTHAVFILLFTALLAGAAWLYTRRLPKQYSTTVTFIARGNPNVDRDSISSGDQAASRELARTSSFIIRTNPIMRKASEKLAEQGVNCTFTQLKAMTRVTTTSSEIFIATITTDDREHITLIARTIADVATVEIKEIMQGQGDVLILEPPEQPAGPVSPNMRSNVLAGAAVGLVLACAFVVIRTLTDTKIWTEDDLARAYEIPVLGTIPQLAGTERQTGQKE